MSRALRQIHLPRAFQSFDTQEECNEYCHTESTVTTLNTWDEVNQYILKPLTLGSSKEVKDVKSKSTICIEKKLNTFYSSSTTTQSYMAKHLREVSFFFNPKVSILDSVSNTLRYLFFHMQNGIFIKIHDNTLAMFVPFANKDYKNVWSEYLSFNVLQRESSLFDYLRYKEWYSTPSSPTPSVTPTSQSQSQTTEWTSNGSLITMSPPPLDVAGVWGPPAPIFNMLIELCESREVPNMDLFLNIQRHPQIKKNLTDATDNVFPRPDFLLLREKYEGYAPICSFYGSLRFGDILVPSSDDWLTCTGKIFPHSHSLFSCERSAGVSSRWKEKIATCFFRGKASDTRLAAAQLSMEWENNEKYKAGNSLDGIQFLDAGITEFDTLNRKQCGKAVEFFNPSSVDFKLKDFVPIHLQSNYKFLLYIPGQSASTRYNFMMGLQSVIFKVASAQHCADASQLWFFPMLKPMFDHIPVKADLSDLAEKITWAKTHDVECMEISSNALQFQRKFLSKNAILDYWQFALNEMSTRRPSIIGIEKSAKQKHSLTVPVIPSMTSMTLEEKEESDNKKIQKKITRRENQSTLDRLEKKKDERKQLKDMMKENYKVYKLTTAP
jgi:hypothetical protein